jgi:ATP-dependent DNA helicase RecG
MELTELREVLEKLASRPAKELETDRLKFVACPADRAELCRLVAEQAVRLANAEGGTIIVGVAPHQKGLAAITGCQGVAVDDLRRAVYQLTEPSILITARLVPGGTGPEAPELLLVSVPKGIPPHVLASSRTSEDLSAEILDVGEEAVDPLEVERLRNTLQAREKSSGLLALSNLELLKALGILSDGDKPRLTKAGLLMVGREEVLKHELPSHEAIYLHMTRETEYDRRVDYRRPLLAILDDLTQQIEPHNRLFTLKVGLFHFEIPDYPAGVYREALLNAFMHRDYARQNPVYVRLYADRMEIANPGGFLGGITADNIMSHEPVSRNRLLAEIMQKLRLVERSGMGVRRLFTILLASGKEPPLYVATPEDVRVVLRSGKTDEPFARFIAKHQQKGEEFSLNELIVLSYLKRNQEIDLAEAIRILQRSPHESHEVLGAMVERKLLEPFGQKKGRVYRLSKAIYIALRQSVEYYLHRDAEATYAEAAITNYIRAHGFITNQMVRTLLRVNRSQSSYLLHKLLKAEKLVLVGKGTKSQYVLSGSGSGEPVTAG